MRSIRSRTLVLVLGLLAVSMTFLSLKSYLDARHEIEELFDAQLAQSARLIAGMVGRDMSQAERTALQQALDDAVSAPYDRTRGHRYESKLAFQVLDDAGLVLLHSASAPPDLLAHLRRQAPLAEASTLPGAPLVLSDLATNLPGYHDVPVDRHGWRVFVLQDLRDGLWVLVGEREDVRGELVGSITLRSLVPDLVGLPLIAVLVWIAIGWGLQPLQRMAALIKAREPETLAPLLLTPLPRELEPVVAALNRLLGQLDTLLEREKRFLADAAHELRTPLAVLRIHAQNALEAPDPADRAEALRHIGGSVERATRVVAQLLTLARLEPGTLPPMREMDLHAFVIGELAELTPLALERQQELVLDVDDPADYRCTADAPAVGVLLQNLVGNAIQYTPEGGEIRVRLQAHPACLMLCVQDSGPGVPASQRERIFDRFVRFGGGEGAGLGLSIVMRVVELHHGRIEVRDSPLGGLEFQVRLPRQPGTVHADRNGFRRCEPPCRKR